MMAKRDFIEWANEEISIFDVLASEFGITDIPRVGESYKSNCPFADEHPDDGLDKGFRTYPGTNSAYCFVIHGQLTPVRLVAMNRDIRYRQAAWLLLESKGLLKRDWKERLPDILAEREALASPPVGDSQAIAQALNEALRSHPSYPPGGVSPGFSEALESEYEALDAMLEARPSSQEVLEWFQRAKERLWAVLDDRKKAGIG